MEFLQNLVNSVNGLVWGPPMLVLILGTGFFLMVMLKFMPLARIGTGFALIWRGRAKGDDETGEISPFQALMTCLADWMPCRITSASTITAVAESLRLPIFLDHKD